MSIEPEVFRDMLEEAELMLPLEQLVELVKYWSEPLLELYWDNFRYGEPIDTRCEGEILSRLDALRGVIGDKRFNHAVSLSCINFSDSVLWGIFLYGSDAQRRAAAREMRFEREVELRDEALGQIWARVRRPQHPRHELTREISRFLRSGENGIKRPCTFLPHGEPNRRIRASTNRNRKKK